MHPLIALGSAAAFLFSGAAGTLVQSEQQILDNFKASQANTGSTLFWDSAAPLCGQPGILCTGESTGEQHVAELNLRGLSLAGSFPQEFGQLPELRKLDLSINSFTGSIPSGISWPLLTSFLAEFNEFTGELPSDLFSAPDIQFFNVSSNQLTGTIPTAISSWDQLQSLDLSSNLFYGTIPEDFISLASLTAFNVRDNHLVGELPAFTFSQFTAFAALGSNQLCPYPDYSSVPTNDYTAPPSTCQACSEFSCQNGATCVATTQGETPTEPQQGQGETPTEAATQAPTDSSVQGGLFGGGRKRQIQPQFTCQCADGYSGQFCQIVAAPSTQTPVTVTQTATTIPQSTTVEQTTTVQITSTIQPSATVQPTTTVQPSTTVQQTTTLVPTTTVLPTVIVQPTTVIQPTTTVIIQPSTVTQATVTTTIPPATYTQAPTTVVQPTATTTVPPATVTVVPSSTSSASTVTTVTTSTATATSTATSSPTTTGGGVFPADQPTGQGTSGVAGLLPAYLLPFALALVGFYFLNL